MSRAATTPPAKRRRRFVLPILVGLLTFVVAGLGGSYWLSRTDPTWYRSIRLSEAEQIAAQNRLVDRFATLQNAVGRSQASMDAGQGQAWPTFEVELTESEVNGFLARWAEATPQIRSALKEMQEPHVRFLDDRIELAGRSESYDTLLNIELSVTQGPEGPRVELGRPWAGRMPLSRSLIEVPGEQGIAALRKGEPTRLPQDVIDAAAGLVAGEAVRPIIPVRSSMSTILSARVEKLTIADGVLKATLRPMAKREE